MNERWKVNASLFFCDIAAIGAELKAVSPTIYASAA
ncbi:hypothetical protein V466_18735 [Pseudomonas mandelii PD30]|uniref:Uncharacterized protein n=1 Tax=Pseudomonas mandelii PD30 TaxID=1419583 RepID=A0A059L060_9PSED|nr:hypothetical protein V466_18735 [Pseudomonas mandelii PD30]